MGAFSIHVAKWGTCARCRLCETRKNIVLYKGKLPCEMLFIGEAPGDSEDVEGSPFEGPAGHLLQRIIDAADIEPCRIGYTNLLGCIPKDENGNKVHGLKDFEKEVQTCAPRWREIVQVAKPQVIVALGKFPEKWLPEYRGKLDLPPVVSTYHPSAILQADESQKGLAYQRAVVTISEAYQQYIIPF